MRAKLDAQARPPMSRGDIKRLRREGKTPVSISARGNETRHFTVPTQGLSTIIARSGKASMIDLQLEGEKKPVMVVPRTIERDPVTHQLLQVGFQQISAKDPITADVRLELVGKPEAVRIGTALLDHPITSIQVKALPDSLPSQITLDVTDMEMGVPLHVSDIKVPAGCEILTAPETVVATVHVIKVAVLPEEEAAIEAEEGEAAPAEEASAAE